jgi:hypothetical protein
MRRELGGALPECTAADVWDRVYIKPLGDLVGRELFHARIWFGDRVMLMHVLAISQPAKVLEGLAKRLVSQRSSITL